MRPALSLITKKPKLILCRRKILCGSALQPKTRLRLIPRRSAAVAVKNGKIVLPLRVTSLGNSRHLPERGGIITRLIHLFCRSKRLLHLPLMIIIHYRILIPRRAGKYRKNI